MTKKNHICLFTATGAENLGDELITLCEIRHFRGSFPGVVIVLFSHSPERTRRFLMSQDCSLEKLEIVQYFPDHFGEQPFRNIGLFFRTLKLLSSVDRVYIGGGGLLYGASEEGHSPLRLWWMRACLAKLLRKPVFYHAIGISAKISELKPFARGLFSGASISVRDAESQKILTELGYSSTVVDDPVFEYIQKPTTKNQPPKTAKTIGLALRAGFFSDETIASLIRGLQKKGYEILFLPHSLHPTDEASHDGYYLQKFLFPGVRTTQSIEQTLEAYSQCDLIIAMRLHSIILSLVLAQPFVAMSYAKKTRSVLESHHVAYFSPETVSAEEIITAVEKRL